MVLDVRLVAAEYWEMVIRIDEGELASPKMVSKWDLFSYNDNEDETSNHQISVPFHEALTLRRPITGEGEIVTVEELPKTVYEESLITCWTTIFGETNSSMKTNERCCEISLLSTRSLHINIRYTVSPLDAAEGTIVEMFPLQSSVRSFKA